MALHPDARHRRSIRLPGYDYRQGGAYFVTICTHGRECALGAAADGEMRLNDAGRIVAAAWDWLAAQYPSISLDASIVMPNHMHGIILLQGTVAAPPQEGANRPLHPPAIMASRARLPNAIRTSPSRGGGVR